MKDAYYGEMSTKPWGANQRPFTGEAEVLASDLQPGSLIRLIRQDNPGKRRFRDCRDAIVLSVRERWFDVVYIDEGFWHGRAETRSLADSGMRPYETSHRPPYWNPSNHTQTLNDRIPTTFHSREEAEAIKRTLDGVSELQDRYGVEPTKPTIQSLALRALLEFTLSGESHRIKYNPHFDQ